MKHNLIGAANIALTLTAFLLFLWGYSSYLL